MTLEQVKKKNRILIKYLNSIIDNYDVKAEYSTNDENNRVITVQEQSGERIVFYGDASPLYNYYSIIVYGLSIKENKEISVELNELIGKSVLVEDTVVEDNKTYKETWQIIFSQFTNFEPIEYLDIRRLGYNSTMKCIVNIVDRKEI